VQYSVSSFSDPFRQRSGERRRTSDRLRFGAVQDKHQHFVVVRPDRTGVAAGPMCQ